MRRAVQLTDPGRVGLATNFALRLEEADNNSGSRIRRVTG
jgi:hypothetical protein